MKMKNHFLLSLLGLLIFVSCGSEPKIPEISPEEAAKMAFEMKQNPDAIPDVLKGASVGMDEWKALLVSIAEDSTKSLIYTSELEKLEGKK
jgi:hypothetical protein